ncbi:MAG: pyroglutamyl-peptidase I [Candidatus Rokuibacteriota bacterium]|nr:MAG: pyroglutamyl-peptidase I [Candidatus Rokubacteria bacterium]
MEVSMAGKFALVTGFEPYGGRGVNPSAEVVTRVDGLEIEGARVVGRVLPVSFGALRACVRELMQEIDPALVVSLGLWPGEPTIRLERVALNLADFEIPDNDGLLLYDDVVETAAPSAIEATLPLRAIERALLKAGIPVRLSTSAGTFLCNATLYTFLHTEQAAAGVRCGFVHLPYLPEQVAALLDEMRSKQSVELHQRADLASMSLATMVDAVRIVLAVSLTATT